jgi:exopolysaccharide/PEP-CTERM locus tyrosine autokinase
VDRIVKKVEEVIGSRTRRLNNTGRPEIVRVQKPLRIDIDGLRACGYLPEADNDRKFRDLYRQIKRPLLKNVLRRNAEETAEDPRLIMVTSALPGDGKTFTSVNLALSLAREREISVLLIDADLLKPQVSKIFGVTDAPGLTDVLTDEKLFPESVVLATSIRGLSLLPAGAPVGGTAELLGSGRMHQILRSLCLINPRWVVLLDSPPLLVTSEGPALLNIAGQVVLVVRAGVTPRQAVVDALALFGENQTGGIVLNEARLGMMHRYYGYGTYGSYGTYGTDDEEGSPKI